ncbi:hypothetical protein GCM10027443_09760 [Pontibacter brevis]
MKKKYKLGIATASGILIILSSLLGFGLWTMAVEDKYGDLQEVYCKSKSGDLVALRSNNESVKRYGIISKTWTEVRVWDLIQEKEIDLNNWVGYPYEMTYVSIYRPQSEASEILKLKDIRMIEEKIHTGHLKRIE